MELATLNEDDEEADTPQASPLSEAQASPSSEAPPRHPSPLARQPSKRASLERQASTARRPRPKIERQGSTIAELARRPSRKVEVAATPRPRMPAPLRPRCG